MLAAIVLVASPALFGQAKSTNTRPSANRDQLGLTCAQILTMSSSDWVAQFNAKTSDAGSSQGKAMGAIGIYGKCYDARTDQLAASLSRKGTAPPTGALASFRDFEQALRVFSAKALATNNTPADGVKTAYAVLYQKQFRYEFYQSMETAARQPLAAKHPAAAVSKGVSPASALQAPAKTPASPTDLTQGTPSTTTPDDADPMTTAKNRFGELLDALAEDQMHQLHSAFGDVVSRGQMSGAARLAVYRYAIFLLEPATAQPFSPPPF